MKGAEERPKILVVDDGPENGLLLSAGLRDLYEVLVATDGGGALARASAQDQPDLILLDVLMPGLDGYEVCRRLKEDERTSRIPIIFLTARNSESDEMHGLSLGAVDYISKPFSLPIVRARIKTHLELKKKTDLLEILSHRDALTGIDNRYSFNLAFRQEWDRAHRGGQHLGLLIADIDHFKDYNDSRGHPEGDECLKRVAHSMRNALRRPADRLARYGGEEFAVILPGTDLEGVWMVGEAIRGALAVEAIPHGRSPVSPFVTLSIGGSSALPADLPGLEVLLASADRRLYEAKKGGRDRTCVGPIDCD